MRRLFEKVFPDSSIEKKQPISPSLPSDIAYSDLTFRTKRGFIARKLAHYLSTDKDVDSLFYRSLSTITFLHSEMEDELYLRLSEQMLDWFEQKKDIQLEIKSLKIRQDIQNAMLKAYEIYKQDLFFQPVIENASTETTNENSKWEVYRDVIYAATQGQFLLITKEEINQYRNGTVLCEGTIKERTDIPVCRNLAKESLEQYGYDKSKLMSWLLVLSEGITNTIKHAEEGKMAVIDDKEKNEIRFVIEDKGPGFPLDDLPKTTLLAGYSTKKSMGQGFTLMMKMTKQVLLHTTSKGSTIILIFDKNKGSKETFNLTG
ncbi:ATP-binding protein [Metabacillus halosaccharovorans]|uniref:ATP-binding protein n=1 Tax=Metabacillus halosaccharovorans TaxID=930124 RepID=UPI00204066F8|nr:ATP-binding protein [Metabacillus halosaccharovorans]MCM3443388.1 ATP-binding protein [Metabacillus halosaccharovorans]